MTVYHFKNKEETLFRKVSLRRGLDIAQQRMIRLAQLQGQQTYSVEDLVRAFLRLHARLHMEPQPISFALHSQVYAEPTQAYVMALSRGLPDIPVPILFPQVSPVVGSYLYAFSDTNRLRELSGPQAGEESCAAAAQGVF